MVTSLLQLLLFVCLFVRECAKDKQQYLRKDMEGDLHMLREFKKFYDKNGLDSRMFDEEITELEGKLK